jgi:hypothetical protein
MSWFRCESDGHERRLTYLRAHGLPADRDTAIDDLRMYQDRVLAPGSTTRMPTSSAFARRWGWPRTNAYRLLVSHGAWSDPAKIEAWLVEWNKRGTAAKQERNARGTTNNGRTGAIGESRNDSGIEAGQERNESEDRRADPHHTTHTPSSELSARARDPSADEVELQVAELLALQEADEPQHGLASADDRAQARRCLLLNHDVAFWREFWAWSGTSEDRVVAGCRGGGWRRWAVLPRGRNGQARIEAFRAWIEAGRPVPTATGPPTRAAPGRRRLTIAEMLPETAPETP